MTADLQGLAALPCLGPASARLLIEAGVETPAQLKKLGAAKAFRALRFTHGKRAGPSYLYALDNAINGTPWRGFTQARLAVLKPQAEQIIRDVDGAADPAFAGADAAGLAAMSSLGKASARMLIQAGVKTPAQLKKIGAEEAYRRLRFTFGRRATATYLYALDIAVRGVHWADLADARMAKLKAAAARIQAEIASPAGAARAKPARKRS